MRKSQPALRLLGERVRHYRKLKGLSQAELAKGICTQATISLIEKRNKVPSMNILMRLIARLGVTLDDIVVTNHNRTQTQLDQVQKSVRHREYNQAAAALEKINVQKLTGAEDKRRYDYFKGIIELFEAKRPDEAIYFFGRVLSPLVSSEHDLLTIMATLGVGLAYAEKKAHDRARVYIEQSLVLLEGLPMNEAHYLEVELTIYWHIGRIYYELAEFDAVLTFVVKAINLAVTNESLFLLDDLYTLRAQALDQQGDDQAPATYEIANALTTINATHGAAVQSKPA